MVANPKFDQFTDGGEMRQGDIPVGLRSSDLTKNFKFNFPGSGIKDVNGNYLFGYESRGASSVNYPKLYNSLTGEAVIYSAEGSDANVDIAITPKGAGVLILDDLRWPISDGVPNSFMYTDGLGNLGFTAGAVVTDITGTANQVLVNLTSGTPKGGSVTLTTPQNINTTSSPTFASLTLSSALTVANGGTGHSSFTTNGILYATGATTLSQITTANSASLVTNSSGAPVFSSSMTNGQLIIGATGGTPGAATLTAGSGISITNAANAITISSSGGGMSWTEVTGTSQSMAIDNGYVANNAGLVTLTLPSTASLGSYISICGKGAGGWLIAQNSGQSIRLGSSTTTVGVGGSLSSTNASDSINLICTTANTVFTVLGAPQGTITVV